MGRAPGKAEEQTVLRPKRLHETPALSERSSGALRAASGFGIPFLLVLYLAFASGGYDLVSRSQVGVIVWWAILLAILAGILPAARVTRAGCIALAVLGALLLWTVAGTLFWTESTERSVIEVSRVATLFGIFLLLILIQGKDGLRHAVTAIAAAVAIVSVITLADRFQPDLLPFGSDYVFPDGYPRARLNYPLEYWNGLATFVAMGAGALLWIAAAGKTIAGRSLAAGMLPLLALVGYLTASRGGVIEGAVVLVVMLILFPKRILLLLSLLIPAAGSILLVVLINRRPELRDFVPGDLTSTQGSQMTWLTLAVFFVAAGLQAAVALVAKRGNLKLPQASRVSARNTGIAAGLVTVLVLVVALASGFIGDRWSEFQQPSTLGTVNRLSNLNSGERYLLWKSATEASSSEKLTGIGPGTFEYWWAREGQGQQFVRDAHSIYLEGLAEMGPVGLLLVVALIFGPLGLAATLALRRGSDETRGLAAAAAAGIAAFAVAAGVDWAWELTVLPVVFFVLAAGVAGADAQAVRSDEAPARDGPPGWAGRIPIAAAAVVMIILIAVPLAGATLYRSSKSSVRSGDLERALDEARQASDLQPYSASAKVQIAQVLNLLGRNGEAAEAAEQATDEEPGNWRNWLVLTQSLKEVSPDRARASAKRAEGLNPKSRTLRITVRRLLQQPR